MEDPALAVSHGPHHRFVLAGAALALVGKRGGQHLDVLERTPQTVNELVAHVHPLARHPARDRMLDVAHHDAERMQARLAGPDALALRHAHQFVGAVEIEAVAETAAAPAHADHLVVFRPAGKGVVGRVEQHEAGLTALDLLLQRLLKFARATADRCSCSAPPDTSSGRERTSPSCRGRRRRRT